MARSPRVFAKLFAGGFLDEGPLSLRRREPVIDCTTARLGCEYEWGVHNLEYRNMSDLERTEKVRQELMRFNELLGIMRNRLADGEQAYSLLYAGIPPHERERTNHKDLQWKLAEQLDDLTPLAQATSMMRFATRELEKAFAELHAIISATPPAAD